MWRTNTEPRSLIRPNACSVKGYLDTTRMSSPLPTVSVAKGAEREATSNRNESFCSFYPNFDASSRDLGYLHTCHGSVRAASCTNTYRRRGAGGRDSDWNVLGFGGRKATSVGTQDTQTRGGRPQTWNARTIRRPAKRASLRILLYAARAQDNV